MSCKIDYWFFENYLTKNEIIKLNKFIESNYDRVQPNKYVATDVVKTSNVLQIEYHKIKDKLNLLIQEVYSVGATKFGYHFHPINDREYFNLNVYSSKNQGEYEAHYDSSNSDMYDIKLTCLINISTKKYEGGKFQYLNLNWGEVKELDQPGNVIMFKSNFHHRVTPVTSGERRTLTHFMSGPRFV
tara:strand:+ start:519 stop:1076 length:558 start_codon:yes stop_codon:yes gene_type:complete